MTVDKQFELLSKKLDLLIRVTGMAACRDLPQNEQIWLLHCVGLSSSDIAELLGSNKNAIDQTLHRMRNRRTPRRSSVRSSRQ